MEESGDDRADLRKSYDELAFEADRFRRGLIDQIQLLLDSSDITLGVPVESRVKTFASINEKAQRKNEDWSSVDEMDDLVGVRIILLFIPDQTKVDALIQKHFDVVSVENTADRLAETQFGYRSNHYTIRIKEAWSELPTFSGHRRFKAELQVRTLAQHIWAAASHKLQYKQEASVPPLLMRSIHRLSALLEVVDLEFERVLSQRLDYLGESKAAEEPLDELNVDTLKQLLDSILPPNNRKESELYADLLSDLRAAKLATPKMVRDAWEKARKQTLKDDKALSGINHNDSDRAKKNVWFSHVGLIRRAMKYRHGPDWSERGKASADS